MTVLVLVLVMSLDVKRTYDGTTLVALLDNTDEAVVGADVDVAALLVAVEKKTTRLFIY